MPFPSLPDDGVKSRDSSTTTDDPLSTEADSELIVWLLLDDLWSLLESCPLWFVLLCEEEELLLLVHVLDWDPCTGGK